MKINLSIFDYSSDSATEWKILGQEKDGSILSTWISKFNSDSDFVSHIGIYNPKQKSFEILHRFDKHITNIVQASCNSYKTLLAYVIKEDVDGQTLYQPFLTVINNADNGALIDLLPDDSRRKNQTHRIRLNGLGRGDCLWH